ncbi:rifin PIR protein, putative [Plasmodium reichenowi]|uniref:Rifin PIR protein, putative n=1 Tax=Plasmodium reichenowi TaxID=5854 RepID=A0A2P9D1D7_PLARE|nr:rifin PIR protein, putative [Plasmodium reichenowi]
MKVHYINILLFAFPLNILITSSSNVSNQRNHILTLHKATTTSRMLCECELYAPANYNNDQEMKEVMENFDRQTSQRFHEYDERMKTTRQKCKEQCDKEIQKIILKDKLEKQMEEQLTTLETKIDTNDIPTCVCEKSMADKTEKFCLNCGKTMGGVAPAWGLVGGLGYAAWETVAMATAIAAAKKAGIEAGVKAVIEKITGTFIYGLLSDVQWADFIKPSNYNIASGLYDAVNAAITSSEKTCTRSCANFPIARNSLSTQGKKWFGPVAEAGKKAAADATVAAEEAELAKVSSASSYAYSPIAYSVIAIVVIVLIMVIIYLILRYRRKKKMKKKLQYIKLLNH